MNGQRLIGVLSTALIATGGFAAGGCAGRANAEPTRDDRAAVVAALGSNDGYLFVFNPFNCVLRQRQILAINALKKRSRRSGRVLMAGFDLGDSLVARKAFEELGIELPSAPLATSPVAESHAFRSMGWPLVLAVRDGRVIAALSGEATDRLDTWMAWLEHARSNSALGVSPGDSV